MNNLAKSIQLLEIIAKILLVCFYSVFVYTFAVHYLATHRMSSLLFMIVESIFAVIALTRREPSEVSTSLYAWVIAFAGTILPLFAEPTGTNDYALGQALQIVGVVFQLCAIISLNRSFGLVAANRGIVTGGMYRFVRHPLYHSYFLGLTGFLINHFSFYNVFLLSVQLMCQLRRIKDEEGLLRKDPAYQNYMTKTPWRLLPLIY